MFMTWQSSIRALRSDTVHCLGALSETLSGLQGVLTKVCDQMRELISAQEQSVGKVEQFTDILQTSAHAMEDWDRRLHDSALGLLVGAIEGDLGGLGRTRLFFQFLATITAIQVAREKSVELSSFVEEMRGMSARIETDLVKAQTGVSLFRSVFDGIARDTSDGARRLIAAATDLAAIVGPLSELERSVSKSARQAADQAQRTVEIAETIIGRLVRAFQFSDSAAQRLDHVDAILSCGQQSPGHGLLAAAQISALAEDARDTHEQLEQAWAMVGALRGAVPARFEENQDLTRHLLSEQIKISHVFLRIMEAVSPGLERIDRECQAFDERVDEVLGHLKSLDDVGQAISLAAVNARVKAARATVAREELGYIAQAVNESAANAVATISVAAQGLGRLRQQMDALDYRNMRARTAELSRLLADMQQRLASADAREQRLAGLDAKLGSALEDLVQLEAVGQERLAEFDAVTTRLAMLAQTLRAAQPPVADLAGLDALQSLYTMTREREVHATLTGAMLTSADEPQDLDSVLF